MYHVAFSYGKEQHNKKCVSENKVSMKCNIVKLNDDKTSLSIMPKHLFNRGFRLETMKDTLALK